MIPLNNSMSNEGDMDYMISKEKMPMTFETAQKSKNKEDVVNIDNLITNIDNYEQKIETKQPENNTGSVEATDGSSMIFNVIRNNKNKKVNNDDLLNAFESADKNSARSGEICEGKLQRILKYNEKEIKELNDNCKFDSRISILEKSEAVKGPKACDLADIIYSTQKIVKIYGRLHIYCSDKGYYKDIEGSDSDLVIRKRLDKCYWSFINRSVIAEIIAFLHVLSEEIKSSDLEIRKNYLNFLDCVYSVMEDKILEHSENFFFQAYINANYPRQYSKEDYNTSYFYKYLRTTFDGYKAEESRFCELMGLAISTIRDTKNVIYLYGASNTGKSVALNLLGNIVGEEFTSSISFSQLGEQFAVATLPGKTLNISGEMSGVGSKRLDVYKSLSGNDRITACLKGKDFFQFRNQTLLVFACNELPEIGEEFLEPILQRMILINFQNSVSRENWITNLEGELQNEQDLILSYAIKGLRKFIENNYNFSESKYSNEKLREFVLDTNNFIDFSKQHIRQKKKNEVPSSLIQAAYLDYCEKNDLIRVSSNVWSKILKKTYGATSTRITNSDYVNESVPYNSRGYRNIELEYTFDQEVFDVC